MRLQLYRLTGLAIILLVMISNNPVSAQTDDYPIVTFGYTEVSIDPSDFSILSASYAPFRDEVILSSLLAENNSMFWAAIGNYNQTFGENQSLSTFVIVQIDNAGFYETLVALDANNQTLEWVYVIESTLLENASVIIESATGFFADDGHYWGLCEEFIAIPGNSVGLNFSLVWRMQFHLVAEGERWMLILDDSGDIIFMQSWNIPCQDCVDPLPLLIGTSLAIALGLMVLIVFFRKRN